MITRRAFTAGLLCLPQTPAIIWAEQNAFWGHRLVHAARSQIGVTRLYDPAYKRLAYPGGDVPRERGVCTDVVVRAYRDAFDVDLQTRVHEDMERNFSSYPAIWGLSRPDANIDHRRVPNLERYFSRCGFERAVPSSVAEWCAGDLCTMRLDGRLPHIGVISDRRTHSGRPYVIHNIGRGTHEDDLFSVYPAERCFRMPPDPVQG